MLGQLIPQVFYDAIARFVPGSVLLGTFILIWPGSVERLEASSMHFPFAVGVAWVIAAYVLALLLEGSWGLIPGATKRLNSWGQSDAEGHALADFERLVPKFDSESFKFPGIAIMYDGIRLKNPVVGANIVKLRAEVQLCRTLFLGWAFILTALAFDVGGEWFRGNQKVVTVGLSVALLLAFLLSLQRQRRAYWSLCNHWLLLVQPGTGLVMEGEMTASRGTKPVPDGVADQNSVSVRCSSG